MKKILVGLLFTGLMTQAAVPAVNKAKVYICDSSSASVYHQKRTCRGLSSCSHEIKYIPESEAIDDYGRRRCKVCY